MSWRPAARSGEHRGRRFDDQRQQCHAGRRQHRARRRRQQQHVEQRLEEQHAIDNRASYSAKSSGIGLSLGTAAGSTGLSAGVPQGKSGDQSDLTSDGITQTASAPIVRITDGAAQQALTGRTADQATTAVAGPHHRDGAGCHPRAGRQSGCRRDPRHPAAAPAGQAVAETEAQVAGALDGDRQGSTFAEGRRGPGWTSGCRRSAARGARR